MGSYVRRNLRLIGTGGLGLVGATLTDGFGAAPVHCQSGQVRRARAKRNQDTVLWDVGERKRGAGRLSVPLSARTDLSACLA